MNTPAIVHYQVPAAIVADHAESHGCSPEELGDRPCCAVGGESTDDYEQVTCPDCIAAGFGPEVAS